MGKIGCMLAGAMLGAVYVFPGEAVQAAWEGLCVWGRTLVPSLGPGMALCLYICTHLRGNGRLLVPAAMLCASPGGARLMQEKKLLGRDAAHGIAVTGVMSPMFFLGAVSGWLGSEREGAAVYLCHIAAALLTGLCIKGKSKNEAQLQPVPFLQCVHQSIQALLNAGFILMFFSAAARMMALALPFLPQDICVYLHCMLEVTGGTEKLCRLNVKPMLPIICFFTSFGGCSVLIQNHLFWQQSGIRIGQLAGIRLIHGLFSFVLCFFLENILFIG